MFSQTIKPSSITKTNHEKDLAMAVEFKADNTILSWRRSKGVEVILQLNERGQIDLGHIVDRAATCFVRALTLWV